MESPGRMAATPQMPADGDMSHSVGQTPTNQLGDQSQYSASHDPRQPRLTTEGWELQRPGGHSFQLEFQDSNLSPALSLLPTVSGEEHNFSEYSLFHKSDNEFAPLRAFPDFSMASERFHSLPQDQTTQASDRGSLSQHPLAQATVLSEEGASSCCSLSQHSLSPGHESRQEEIAHSLLIVTGNREKDSGSPAGEAAEDEMFFLRKDVPAKQLLECLQKDVGMLSSSSVVSSASGASMTSIASLVERSRSTNVCKPGHDQSMVKREGPPGEASLSQQQTQQLDKVLNRDETQTRSSEVCNITMGSRSTQPDDTTEVLHRELLSEAERLSSREPESKNQQWKTPAPPAQSVTPNPVEMSVTNHGQLWTEPFSAGVIRIHREQDLLSSGNQTGIDGSYLGFLPQSQSTPGVFLKGPLKSSVKAKLGQLSVVESNKDGSYQSNTSIPPSTSVPMPEDHHPDTAIHCLEEATTAKVQSLPSLNYMEKVDAWRANQSLGKTSLFDSLALQGFSGISPKKKAYDAVSHSLNRILSEHVRNLQQPPVSNAANQTVTQGSSTAPSSSSSPARGEAVGSAPNDKDNTRSVTQPSASPFGRSQSHSSLSTVVMLVQKDQQTERHAEKEKSQDDTQQLSVTVQPSLLVTLGQFSDVSVDRDVTLSSSQDSYNSGIKLGTSVGTSSVTSLEVDNYAPYWTSKLSTPPPSSRPRELNIEERIPLYLRNLGIDQSPSNILTPFVPRGPIREPEFSPTDLCTIKGSIGTPSKSTQPSEGGSPHKGEFSRSSILSVDSSISIPFSLDSLAPAVPLPEQTRHACSLSDAEVLSERRLVSSPQPSHFSILQPSQQQQKDSSLTSSQNAVQPGERLCPTARSVERNVVSPLQTSCSMNESAEDSLVSSKALWEIRKLLSQAENVISAGSSAASATSTAVPRLLSDGDVFPSTRKKTTTPQNSLFSSSAPEDPRTHSSFLGARSSSDSMLISERPRQSSVGRESVSLSWQPGYSSTQALITSPAADMEAEDGTEQSSLVLSKSVRRSEPEGCSAAPPDNKVPTQPPVVKPLSTVSPQQTSTSSDTVEVPEETEKTRFGGSAQSSSSSRILEEIDQGVVSDVSSESSLAVRVAKLLQSESPATMVSSTTSITDQEEGKAREWIKMKISGQQCETLELGNEDRERIEEIKRELLLKNPIKSQGSTDTESSVASSVRVPMRQDPPQPAERFALVSHKKIQVLQGLSTDLLDSSVQPQNPPHPDLEAQVRDIASREGVTLPRTKPQAFTSITIATRRRSTSPSPSTSPAPPLSPAPEPLHLTELSTGAGEHPKANRPLPPTQYKDIQIREPALLLESSHRFDTRNQNLDFNLLSGNQKRQGTVGGQLEECTLPSRDLDKEDVSVQDRCISDGGGEKSPARTGHISHVHLTLSPKATDHSLTVAAPFSHAADVTGPAQKGFAPLRHSSSAPTSPDEGVGLSSPPEWLDTREPKSQSGLEKTGTSNQFKTIVTQQRIVSTSAQSFKQRHRPEVSTTSLTTESPVPVLLPYKPHGSEELFYVPQTEADISDTTVESSHTGSDDAVPPRFTSEVLGSQDPGLDRGVNIRHLEGIYSKRLKTTTFRMQQLEHRDKSSQTGLSQTVKPSSQVLVAFTRVPLSNKQEASRRDQGTSPVHFLSNDQLEPSSKVFQSVQIEMDYNKTRCPLNQSSFHEADGQWDHQRRDPHVLEPMSQQRSSSLDQLWQRFCDRWSLEEVQSTNEREMLLRERLERLSHLIHSTKAANVSGQREKEYHDPYSMPQTIGKKRQDATREDRRHAIRGDGLHYDTREMERNIRGSRQAGNDRPIHHHAWTQSLQVEGRSQSLEDDSHDSYASSLSHSSFQSQHLCPADKDETETLSITSGSMSTIDTARLIRAFGAHRVQHLKTGSSLSKLYSTINKQKEGREQRRGRNRDPPLIITPSETTGTDESVAADYASSTSTYTLPSHRGPSRSLAIKKGVKLVSKGIQAGDLEIVSHGTRRHTRDVGTTFPSPRETRVQRTISSSSSSAERGRGEQRSPSKSHGLPKQRNGKRNLTKHYPEAVSWFISVDNLKENKPEELSTRPSTTWFESYSRRQPWREPLRQRQVYEDRNQQPGFTHDAEMDPGFRTKTVSSGLARVSLQEALEMRRPEFISRSRQRVRRLTLQVEERKLLADTSEGDKFFHKHGGLGGMPKPAGTALLRRAVPRKEMIQRSKQIYENLPEVQKRREEERRKVEYQSYRLNAQLYNKRITNRVLSRRSVWQ